MAWKPLLGIEVAGYGMAVPDRQVSNAGLIAENGLNSSPEWIEERTGIEFRYVAEPEDRRITTGLSIQSGRAALEMAGLEPPYGIDSLILATTTPDLTMPATSALVQHGLNANKCGTHDVSAACAGFAYALNEAYLRIHGGEDRVLVIGTDILFSRLINREDRDTAILFGDGSGAVLLQRSERENAGLLGYHEITDGSQEKLLYCEDGDILKMNGQGVLRYAIPLAVEASSVALEKAGLDVTDLDLIIPHQANKRILDIMAGRLGISRDIMVWTGDEYANTSAASIPIALAKSLENKRAKPGDKILMVGFGAGLTAAASVIRF